MSGICGIISKTLTKISFNYDETFSLMLNKLGCDDSQLKRDKTISIFCFGNVTLLNDNENKNFIFNEKLGISCIVDGLVYLNEEHKKIIHQEYKIDHSLKVNQYLPYLLDHYGADFINKITGWYNIFILDTKSDTAFLFNDRLGYLPIFIYESKEVFVFASKIESILASGLLPNIEFDITSVAEHLFFNYIISDNTFIKHIKTLPPASLIQFDREGLCQKTKYWNFRDFYADKPINKKDSFSLLEDGLKSAMNKLDLKSNSFYNVSLTGGWDSRVVLSYLMSYKKQLNLYSFGAKGSPDIVIPQQLALSENISYTPYILDQHYLEKEFFDKAKQTILKSNGSRHFKRTHYVHAMEQISKNSDTVVSGIYGDEILKITGVKPGDVISKNALDFISSDFDVQLVTEKFESDALWNFMPLEKVYLNEFAERMDAIKNSLSEYSTIQQKYYHFRFLISLPRYFGSEINSYNDYCYNFSPFIDYDFLTTYFRNYYCGLFYPYNSNSLLLKRQTTELYYQLTAKNNKQLTYYTTDRGYSMADASNAFGFLKIMYSRFFGKHNYSNAFNTLSTNEIFKNALLKEISANEYSLPVNHTIIMEGGKADILSLYYWLIKVSEKYALH
jgi:hypothetical protein